MFAFTPSSFSESGGTSMNVLFVYYLPSGGVETLNRQRAFPLIKEGINCHFLYYHKKRDLVNNHEGQTFITNNDEEIKQIIKTGNYEAIIVTSDYRGLSRIKNLGYTGLLIFEIQGLGTVDTAKSELQKAFPIISQHSDGILCSKTPHILDILNKQSTLPPLFVFNNCFDTSHFSYNPDLTTSDPIIGWIGRLEENKNWKEFLQIGHKLIHEYNPSIQLYMFEDPTLSSQEERKKFYETINQLKLKKNIKILSNIPHEKMADFYSMIGNSGGFLCSTSIIESFGYAIVEAMSCLCPVLSTKSDGVINSIIHDQTGKYYTIGNITEAFNEGKELISNHVLREHIRTTALQHVKAEFNPDYYGLHFTNMLNKLRGRNGK